ncbi:MAG: putative bifunctional diguanylate cyclase/phosphodiesterase [Rhizobiaceae bacterium]
MPQARRNIPDDVYIGFVKSLFKDAHILLIGAACHGLVAMLVYLNSGDPIYLGLTVALVAAGLYRYATTKQAKDGEVITDMRSALEWERTFFIGGTIQGLAAGLFSFTAIYLAPDTFGEVAAVGVIIGSSVTIVGRNYGSGRMVLVLSVCVILPICVAWMLKGELSYFILGLFMIPYVFAMTQLARNVREVLFAAITGEKVANFLAERFDRALNTMTSGLIMLSREGKVIVANAEAAALMQVDNPRRLMGRTLRALLMRGVAAGMLDQRDSQYAEAQLTGSLLDGKDRKIQLKLKDGRYFEFTSRGGRHDLGVVTFEEVTQRIKAEERIRQMARYDNLSGLPNRAYFQELVSELMASGDRRRKVGLVIFDLDDFKSVNDTLGHPVGDGMILAVAERLQKIQEPNVHVGRFGGDEFMVYFDDMPDKSTFSYTIDRILGCLNGDVDVAGHNLRIQVSGGAVMASARDADFDALVVKADLALYTTKESGKNGWKMFEPAMDQAFRNRQLLKADLRQAVEAGGLRVVYQPIVSMQTMRIASCEALCRWDHPDLGPISPAIFIPLAEEMGIVSDISDFMLHAATQECMRWPEDISVSINLSAKDFRNDEIISKVRRALDASGLDAHRLEIEVTETALLDDKSQTRAYIEELKALGLRIALDDFGTGYSSLSYLHTLPLDKIKIDRSFLVDVCRDKRSLELLKGVVALSNRLGLLVTVEGVETFDQLQVLAREVKPELVQGFLFGAALTATGIDTMATTTWPFAKQIRESIAYSKA